MKKTEPEGITCTVDENGQRHYTLTLNHTFTVFVEVLALLAMMIALVRVNRRRKNNQ